MYVTRDPYGWTPTEILTDVRNSRPLRMDANRDPYGWTSTETLTDGRQPRPLRMDANRDPYGWTPTETLTDGRQPRLIWMNVTRDPYESTPTETLTDGRQSYIKKIGRNSGRSTVQWFLSSFLPQVDKMIYNIVKLRVLTVNASS